MNRPVPARAFTLVELLVVITIIGILIALLLPAVQAAREAGRVMQCQNHVRQMGVAALQHEQANGWLPTGGWGYGWVGEPVGGFGREQPGGFFYNCLPYLEQQALHDLPATGATTAEKMERALAMCQTPLVVLTCPTRRQPAAEPVELHEPLVNCAEPDRLFTADYKANGGSTVVLWGFGPASREDAVTWAARPVGVSGNPFLDMSATDGVCAQRSQVRIADLTDGASMTYLLGEKYLNPDPLAEEEGEDTSSDNAALSGDDNDLLGWTEQPPRQDTPGFDDETIFGSAHAGGCNMGFADGSVRSIQYSIDAEVHRRLGSRKDGQVIDGGKL